MIFDALELKHGMLKYEEVFTDGVYPAFLQTDVWAVFLSYVNINWVKNTPFCEPTDSFGKDLISLRRRKKKSVKLDLSF